MKFPKHSLARQALPDRPISAAGVLPRLASDSASTQRALELLVGERCNLMVTSASGERLAQWGRTVASALRSRSDVLFEVHMPASSESLVARFNAAMASLSLKSARSDSHRSAASLRVLLVADPQALLAPDGQLFAKLVTDFPAAGFRFLILAESKADSTDQLLREGFARRLRQLSLDSPLVDKASVMPDAGPAETKEAKAFLPLANAASASGLEASPRPGYFVNEHAEGLMLASVRRTGRGRRLIGWGAGIVSLILVSILVVVLVNRDRSPAWGASGPSQVAPRSASAAPAQPSAKSTGSPGLSVRSGDVITQGQRP
jgi:hypothetical protein